MKRSTNGILTSHTGCLVQPADLYEMLQEKEQGKPVDLEALDLTVRRAVMDVVRKQADAGLTVVNDGEESNVSYST